MRTWLAIGFALAVATATIAAAPKGKAAPPKGKTTVQTAKPAAPPPLKPATQPQTVQLPNVPVKELSLQNASLPAVFQYLSKIGDINIVVSPSVAGTVNLDIHDVTWRQALDIVVKQYNLKYIAEVGYLRIMRMDDYFNEEVTKATSSQRLNELLELQTHTVNVKYADAMVIAGSLRPVLSTRGTVTVDARTNSLIIKDIGPAFKPILELITELDRETDQIRLNGRIIQVDDDASRELGVNWNNRSAYAAPSDQLRSGAPDSLGFGFIGPGSGIGQFAFGVLSGNFQMNAFLTAITTDNRGKILDRPEVTTVDNTQATITSSQQLPFFARDEAGNTTVQQFPVTTEMSITPHITAGNRVLMKMNITRSSFTGTPPSVIITSRSANTTMLVDDGQTAVIGGLTTEQTTEVEEGIPFLKDIPLIGFLFRSSNKRTLANEIIILITPTIIHRGELGNTSPTKMDEGYGKDNRLHTGSDTLVSGSKLNAH